MIMNLFSRKENYCNSILESFGFSNHLLWFVNQKHLYWNYYYKVYIAELVCFFNDPLFMMQETPEIGHLYNNTPGRI